MKLLKIICVVVLLIPNAIFGQSLFRSYPEPKVTPEVLKVRESIVQLKSGITRLATRSLPASIDNSTKKYFPPIILQIGGSCAFASGIGYMFTYEMNRMLDRDSSRPGNRFSYLYTWNLINNGIDEGSFVEMGLHMVKNTGAMSLKNCPNQVSFTPQFHWPSGYDKYIDALHYRVKDIIKINAQTEADIERIKQYLAESGIVTFSSNSEGWSFQWYDGPSETGYRRLLTGLATEGSHAMTIAGYDDTVEFDSPDGKSYGAFIVVNSWGEDNHDNGRFYLPYYFFLRERAANLLSHEVIGVSPEYVENPEVVFKVKLSSPVRNSIAVILGAADKPYAETPTVTYNSPIIAGNGGAYPLQGIGRPGNIEVAIDFSSQAAAISSFSEPKYFLNILKSGSTAASVEHFSILDYRENPTSPREYVYEGISDGHALASGSNLFALGTTEEVVTSASLYRWFYEPLYHPNSKPYAIKTANGKYVKMQFVDYDNTNGKVTFKYVYQSDGSNNLYVE